jgi:sarcosine oxidase subunit beta
LAIYGKESICLLFGDIVFYCSAHMLGIETANRGLIMITKPKTVVIVGAGIVGLSTAFHLAEKGVERIVIVEKGKVGDGSSIRAGGIVTMLQDNESAIRARSRSLDIFERFSSILPGYTFHQVGCLNLMREQDFVNSTTLREIQTSLGARIEVLRGSEIQQKFPDIHTTDEDFGVLDLRGGYSEPHRYIPALLAKVRELGVEVRENQALVEFTMAGEVVTGVITRGRRSNEPETSTDVTKTIKADAVICTVNSWANHVLSGVGFNIPMKNFIHERFVTKRFPTQPILPAINDNVKDGYVRPTDDNRLLLGTSAHNPDEFVIPHPDFTFSDLQPDPRSLTHLKEHFTNRVPLLQRTEWDYHRVGLISFAMDSNPVIGPVPGLGNFYIGVNFHSGGFGYNPVAGLLLSEYVVNGKTSVDVDSFLPDRFACVDTESYQSMPLKHHDILQKRH